ncbi:MAG: hypothetical protein ACHQ50_08145 [Fimbriimonadales bacterium]
MMVSIALAALAVSSGSITRQGPEVHYANVTYRLPAGWKADPGHEYVPYMVAGSSKVASMTISRPQPCSSFLMDASGLFADMLRSQENIDVDGPRSFTVGQGSMCMFASVRQNTSLNSFAPIASIAAIIDLGQKSQEVTVDLFDPKRYDAAKAGTEQVLRSMSFADEAREHTPPRWQKNTGPSAIVADLDIEVAGGGPYKLQITNSHCRYRVKRTLSAHGIRLTAGKAPIFERSVLNSLTDHGEGVVTLGQDRPHPAIVTFSDEDYSDGDIRVPVGSKEHPRFKKLLTWTAPPGKPQRSPVAMVDGLRVAIDRTAGSYVLTLPGLSGGVAMSEVDYVKTDENLSLVGGRNVYPPVRIPMGIFTNLHPNPKFTGGALGASLVRRLPAEPESGLPPIDDQITVDAYYKPWGPVTITYKWHFELA